MAHEFSELHQVTTVSRSSKADLQLDVSDIKTLEKTVSDMLPDVIINAVKPPIPADQMEQQIELATRLNVELPAMLASLQHSFGYILVHISTDWVYAGREGEVYSESSHVLPLNFYAKTKLEAERRVLSSAPSSLVLRSEGIFGLDERRSNLFLRLKDASTSGIVLQVASDQFSQPICGTELARVARVLIEKKVAGLFNVVGREYLSRLEFARLVCSSFGFDAKLAPFSITQRAMNVPSHLRVDVRKVEGITGRIKSLFDQFEDLKKMGETHGH